jgi:hypothetical protein
LQKLAQKIVRRLLVELVGKDPQAHLLRVVQVRPFGGVVIRFYAWAPSGTPMHSHCCPQSGALIFNVRLVDIN